MEKPSRHSFSLYPHLPEATGFEAIWEDILRQEDRIIHLTVTADPTGALQAEAILCDTVSRSGADADTCTALLHWANVIYAKSLQYAQIPASVLGNTYLYFCRELCRLIPPEDFRTQHLRLLTAYSELCSAHAFKPYSPLTKSILHYIHENLTSRLALQNLAAHTGFSPTYVSHRFKKEVGIAPMQYITRERMRIAVYLLRTTDHCVQDIANTVGFTDMSYFSKLFRQTTGQTPSQFRGGL